MKNLLIAIALMFGGAAIAEESASKEPNNTEECSVTVIAKSPGAVANPCMTTRDFVASLDLSDKQQRKWQLLTEQPSRVGSGRMSH